MASGEEAALHTFPITDNGDCWVTSIIQAWQTFHRLYLTMNSSLSLAFDSTESRGEESESERERHRQRVRDVLAAFSREEC